MPAHIDVNNMNLVRVLAYSEGMSKLPTSQHNECSDKSSKVFPTSCSVRRTETPGGDVTRPREPGQAKGVSVEVE